MLDAVPVSVEATVLDLGAGTGKLTRVLADRYARVIALEPLAELRAILEERVPQAEPLAVLAEAIPLPDTSVDAVFAGQAFHWFANEVALAEIARVLRPGGVLARLWNEAIEPSPLPEGYRRRLSDLHDAMRPTSIDERIFERAPFGEVHEGAVEHDQRSSRDDVLAFAASVSWIASRDDREDVVARLGALLPEATYAIPNRANVIWARKR